MQGATYYDGFYDTDPAVSIHAPYAGSDFYQDLCCCQDKGFNPRPLCRERRSRERAVYPSLSGFQSTPPMQGATDSATRILTGEEEFQSTPPMQGATVRRFLCHDICVVSIHAPYAGSDAGERGETLWKYVSIHAPYAGSDVNRKNAYRLVFTVSIHAPYAGSDAKCKQSGS